MKTVVVVLALFTAFLGFRVFTLEAQVRQLQTNEAIAVLSSEAANAKVGAIAPYFERDADAFAKAWIDNVNLPPAVFPDEVLTPLRQQLERARQSPEAAKQRAELFR